VTLQFDSISAHFQHFAAMVTGSQKISRQPFTPASRRFDRERRHQGDTKKGPRRRPLPKITNIAHSKRMWMRWESTV